MLSTLHQAVIDGNLLITHAYLGHIKKEEEGQKRLLHSQSASREDIDQPVRVILEQYLHQMIEGARGEVNFNCHYTGEMLSTLKVASPEYDRTHNRPAVEVLEAIRDMETYNEQRMTDLGNLLAYKVMAAGAINNHLVALLRFEVMLGVEQPRFTFATLVDLHDREASLYDERSQRFVTTLLTNAIKGTKAKAGALFPCLDENGAEAADLLVMSSSGAPGWFRALEASRRLPPAKEGKLLITMVAEQAIGGLIGPDLFSRMGAGIAARFAAEGEDVDGIPCAYLMDELERALGHGINRLGFQARWEIGFGSLEYRPLFDSLFGAGETYKPTKLKMQAGGIAVPILPSTLEDFRQLTVGEDTYIVFRVPEQAKVPVAKDLALHVRPADPKDLVEWMNIGKV